VQDAMKQAGTEALGNSAVQQAIVDAAKKQFSAENAKLVAEKVQTWSQDPETQAKARHYAGMAMEAAGTVGEKFIGVIEQGPAGVRVIAFLAGLASVVTAIWYLIDFGHLFGNFIGYAMAIYQVFFAFTTMLFEAKPEWIQKAPAFLGLDRYQNLLIEYCKALTVMGGRGLFYTFQGLMWLLAVDDLLKHFLYLAVGSLLVFVGILCFLMHFNIMPSTVSAKASELGAQAKSYMRMPQDP